MALGWRIAIVLAATTLIWRLIDGAADALSGPDYDRTRHALSAVATTALAVPMIVLAYRYLDRLPFSALRRARPRTAGGFLLAGMAGHVLPAAAAVAALTATGHLEIGLRGSPVLPLLALAALVLAYEALPEELIFRGYLYRNLATALPPWAAVLGQAVLFTVFGVAVGAATSADRIVLFLAFAVVQGTIRAVTGTLWAPVGFHLAFQTSEQFAGPHWNRLTADDPALLQQVALGLVPLALGVTVIRLLTRRRTPPPAR
jgi:membrane protease YdiL (CAAX protease family)